MVQYEKGAIGEDVAQAVQSVEASDAAVDDRRCRGGNLIKGANTFIAERAGGDAQC